MRDIHRNSLTVSRLLCAVLSIVALSACQKESPQAPPMGPLPVTVAKPILHSLVEWDRFTGRFNAVEAVDIRARVAGYLKSAHFVEGSIVKKGQLLFIIDERPFQAALQQSIAAVTEAKARLKQADASLSQAKASLSESTAQKRLAQSRLERAQKAVETNAIAREQVDVRESELAQATAATESSLAMIAEAEAGIATANAAIATAQAGQRAAKINLDFCRISSPIRGRIGRRLVTQGNLIDGGSIAGTLLTTVVSLDPIYCDFDASEQDFLKYMRLSKEGERESSRRAANPVYASLVDETGYPHLGHMDYVANRLDQGTGTIRGRAIFPNEGLLLTPGLFASVRIPGTGKYEAILLPDAAIGTDLAQKFVLTLNEENLVEPRIVTLGPTYAGLRIIRTGLKGNERVIIEGLMRARPGAPVIPQMTELKLTKAKDALPDDYQPVPEGEWLSKRPTPAPKQREAEDEGDNK